MINNLPAYISVVFGLTTLLTFILFYSVVKHSATDAIRSKANLILIILLTWIILQSLLGLNNFYSTDTKNFPPRFFPGCCSNAPVDPHFIYYEKWEKFY